MATFTLASGQTFEQEGATGKYLQVLAKRVYTSPEEKKDEIGFDNIVDAIDKRVTYPVMLRNRTTHEAMEANDTYLLAENKDYKDYSVVDEYDGESAMNASERFLIEVVLILQEWKTRLLIPFRGRGFSFFDVAKDINERIWDMAVEEQEEGEGDILKEQGVSIEEDGHELQVVMWRHEGDYETIDVNERDLENAIASIRLVEFEHIIDKEEPFPYTS